MSYALIIAGAILLILALANTVAYRRSARSDHVEPPLECRGRRHVTRNRDRSRWL